MARLWVNDPETPEGKYLVKRRDGTVPAWPHFVLAASDPAAPAALRAYAAAGERRHFDPAFTTDVRPWPTGSRRGWTRTRPAGPATPTLPGTEPTTRRRSPRCGARPRPRPMPSPPWPN